MTAHTPGPWKATSWGQTIAIDQAAPGTYMGLAHIRPNGNPDAGTPTNEDRANARLIAAAPAMLSMLKKWREIIVGTQKVANIEPWARDLDADFKAVIAAAEGSK